MRVTLINQFYPPARAPTGALLRDLARTLRGRGHDVTVLASAGGYGAAGAGAGPAEEDGIRVLRLGAARPHGVGFAAKALDYARFHAGLARALRRRSPRPDVIVAQTTPPFCGAVAARFAGPRGIPFLLWCMDLYPEALAANGRPRPGGRLYRGLARLARYERARAAAVVAIGPDMRALVERSAPDARVTEIPVWSRLAADPAARAAAEALRRERGWGADERVLLYSGNMGRAHRADEFAALAARLRDVRPRVRWVFCGAGRAQMDWLRAGAGLFEWLDPVADADVAAHLLSADLHLLSQQPAWTGVVVPSKYQAALALGRPVVFAGPPDAAVARWIAEDDTGWILPPDDADALARVALELRDPALVRARGGNAARQHRRRFDPGALAGRLADRVEAIAPRAPPNGIAAPPGAA